MTFPHETFRSYVPQSELSLPLRMESFGFNADQEAVSRPRGYECVHWLHTESGAGRVSFGGAEVKMEKGQGVLFMPGDPHSYRREGVVTWKTWYVTFDGSLASEMLVTLGLQRSAMYRWPDSSAIDGLMAETYRTLRAGGDPAGNEVSGMVYRFLLMLRSQGSADGSHPISATLQRLAPLLEWLDGAYADPAIGSDAMAAFANLSSRHLMNLFRKSLGFAPYEYLISLRIRKSKHLLLESPDLTVKTVAAMVGFREPSHFIRTFRAATGSTPERFRTSNGR